MLSTEILPVLFRFLFGGSAVVISTIVAKKFGGRLGGVFAAFPAIYLAAILGLSVDFRQDNNRIPRKPIGFLKKIKCLYNQIRLCCTHFNFCRNHMGLTKERQDGIKEKRRLHKNLELLSKMDIIRTVKLQSP